MITIITDCMDDNAKARQISRAQSLFNKPVSFIGAMKDISASGNIIDILDAVGDAEQVILANVAPRNGSAKKWSNGTPFGFFRYKNTWIIGTVDGLVFSLAKRFGVMSDLKVTEIAEVAPVLAERGIIEKDEVEMLVKTQFRSFNYLPRLAYAVYRGYDVPAMDMDLGDILEFDNCIWWVDVFGNLKTTVVDEGQYEDGEEIEFAGRRMRFYNQLKSVPDDEVALVRGSSGLGERRFLEIMKQGGSAQKELDLGIGDLVI